jgi:hypothetical protein
MSKHSRFDGQKGFGATAALFMIGCVVAIGSALIYANRDTGKDASSQTARGYASVVLKQGVELRAAYKRYVANGGDISQVTFTTTAGTGLFDPAKGYLGEPLVPAMAMTPNSTEKWRLNRGLGILGLDNPSPPAALLGSLTLPTCLAINHALYGANYSTEASLPESGNYWNSLNALNGGGTTTALVNMVIGWDSGCHRTGDGKYYYFTALAE